MPTARGWKDLADIGQELSPEMVAGMQPMEADEVSDRWALREYWATANAEILSDRWIDDWHHLRLRQLYLRSREEQ